MDAFLPASQAGIVLDVIDDFRPARNISAVTLASWS